MEDFQELDDLDVMHETRALAVMIYKHTDQSGWTLDFIMRDEVRKTAITIGTDIARGYGMGTSNDIERQLRKSRGNCFMLITLLELGEAMGYIKKEELQSFEGPVRTIVRMIDDLLHESGRRRRSR